MKIAFVTFEYPPHMIGGAGTYAFNITKELGDLGHEVHVFTPNGTEHPLPPNVKIEGVPVNYQRPFGALQFWLALPNVFKNAEREIDFDVIHFNGTSYWFLNKLADIPKVVTIHHLAKDSIRHDREAGILLSLIEKRAMERSERIVAVSKFTRKRIVDGYHIDPDRIGVVYNGGSYPVTSPVNEDEAKKIIEGSNGRKTVLFVGRVNDRRKGLDLLLRGMKPVLERTDAMLIVAGKGDQSEMKGLCVSLGIESNVLFTGYVDDPTLLGLYKTCDVYVCPSRLEGFGITVLDAQMFAKKVIATRIGPIPEIAAPSTMLVEPEDINSLSSAIVRALAQPEGRVPNGTLTEQDPSFTWKGAARQLLDEYELAKK